MIKKLMLIVCSIILIFPIIFMISHSFMSSGEIINTYSVVNQGIEEETVNYLSFKLIPENVSLMQYYTVLFRTPSYLAMFWNSVFLTASILIGNLVISSLGAFAFAKLKFPFRDKIFFVFIIVMLMPYQVTLVPNYIILKRLNLIGKYSAIILPSIFAAFGVFLLRQVMISIPDEYIDAAKMDGASYINIFINIVLPQSKSGIASLIILNFIDTWNMVEQPLIFLKDSFKYPLSIYLNKINQNELGIAFVCGVLYMTPAILIFLYNKENLIDGIQMSGIK